MLCEYCGVREAEVEFLDVSREGVRRYHLCRVCAARLAVNSELLQASEPEDVQEPYADSTRICSRCGLRFDEYQQTGKFGCPGCYFTFWDLILSEVEKYHDASTYRGRVYERNSRRYALFERYFELTQRLEITAAEENFEVAAKLKREIDRIKRILRYEDTGEGD